MIEVLTTGIYDFEIIDGATSRELVVDGINLGAVVCHDSKDLHGDQRASDGLAYSFLFEVEDGNVK